MATSLSPAFSTINMPVLLGQMEVKRFNHVLGVRMTDRGWPHILCSVVHMPKRFRWATMTTWRGLNLVRLGGKVADPYKLGQRNRHRIKCPFVHMLDRVERCDVKVGQFLCSLSSKSQHTQTYLRLGARWGYRTPACWLARLFLQGLRVWLMRNLSQQQWKTWDWYI